VNGVNRSAVVVASFVAALVLAAAALPDYQHRYTTADQVAARAATMRLTDLDARWALSGEPAAYDDNGGGCPGYQPRHDDLTVTGAAASEFTGKGTFFRSQVAVLRSAGMAVTDWDRSFGVPGFLPCLRAKVIREFAGQGSLVSIGRLRFPSFGPRTRAYRLVLRMSGSPGPTRMVVDGIFVSKGRTEITLLSIARGIRTLDRKPDEIQIVKRLLQRRRA